MSKTNECESKSHQILTSKVSVHECITFLIIFCLLLTPFISATEHAGPEEI